MSKESDLSPDTPLGGLLTVAKLGKAEQLVKMQDSKFTNTQWVQENLKELDPNDENKTFAAVQRLHPLFGCSWQTFDNHNYPISYLKSCTLEQASMFADAVAVCCYEKLGHSRLNGQIPIQKTAVGNAAFVALHHCNRSVRRYWTKKIEKFQSQLK